MRYTGFKPWKVLLHLYFSWINLRSSMHTNSLKPITIPAQDYVSPIHSSDYVEPSFTATFLCDFPAKRVGILDTVWIYTMIPVIFNGFKCNFSRYFPVTCILFYVGLARLNSWKEYYQKCVLNQFKNTNWVFSPQTRDSWRESHRERSI